MIFKTQPMIHQEAATALGIRTLQQHQGLALFGEVGTGKSKIALDIFLNQVSQINALIILCPKSLMSTWEKEIHKHTDLPNHKIIRWDLIRAKKSTSDTVANMLSKNQYIFIVNIEALSFNPEPVNRIVNDIVKKPTLIVLDESVKIQTPSSNRTKNSIALAKMAWQRVIMTGTDISSGPHALYSQFLFLDKEFWKKNLIQNYLTFKSFFTVQKKVYIQSGKSIDVVKRMDEMTNLEKSIQKGKLEKLNDIINPVTIRILRKDCLDLPPQINVEVPIELSKEEMKAYRDMRDNAIAEVEGELIESINAISVFSKLRQCTSGHISGIQTSRVPSKLNYLLEDIEGHDENAIIVAYFQRDVEIIEKALLIKCQEYKGMDPKDFVGIYYGGNSDKSNEENKAKFEQGKLRFLVASHEMIAQGHNLQEHCSLMYIYSVSLNSEVNAQYKGRIDRTGQTKNPVYKYLLAKGTIDESIHELIEAKLNVQAMFSDMGKKDLVKILKGEK